MRKSRLAPAAPLRQEIFMASMPDHCRLPLNLGCKAILSLMFKGKSPREKILAVLPRTTEMLWFSPFFTNAAAIYFHHFPHLVSLHIMYFLFVFYGSAGGEAERYLALDEAGRGVGAGDVFGAMRSPIVNSPFFDLSYNLMLQDRYEFSLLLIRESA
jgi:hypothetical protein